MGGTHSFLLVHEAGSGLGWQQEHAGLPHAQHGAPGQEALRQKAWQKLSHVTQWGKNPLRDRSPSWPC